MGFQAQGVLGTVDGHGFGAYPGLAGDEAILANSVKMYRDALDHGQHAPVGVLKPGMSDEELQRPFTFRSTASYGQPLGGTNVRSAMTTTAAAAAPHSPNDTHGS